MNMQNLKIFILLLVVCACRKDGASDTRSIYDSWEAKSFMSIESVAYPKAENKKILLTFDRSGVFSLKLDINGCGGNFTLGQNSQLGMTSPICTEICCDSKFSEKLVQTLSKVTSYTIEGNILKLNVPQWGWIELKLAE